METTEMSCEAKQGSKSGTDATGTTTSQEKTGAKRGRPVDCTVRTGCKATIRAGVVKPYGQVCRKETRKVVERSKTFFAAKPGRGSVSLDRRGRGAEKKGKKKWSTGIDPLATKLERSPTARSCWGQVRPN